MTCPGGCIGGGGQPIPTDRDIVKKRMEAIYEVDRNMPLRKSHENPAVKELYETYLGKPLSQKSHHLLHTTYSWRSPFGAMVYKDDQGVWALDRAAQGGSGNKGDS